MDFPEVYQKYLEMREEIKAMKKAEEQDIELDKQIQQQNEKILLKEAQEAKMKIEEEYEIQKELRS